MATDAEATAKSDLFWDLAAELMGDPAVSRSTMMGLPCLRLRGTFFASLDTKTQNLIVKLPASRVAELIDRGDGILFAPNHQAFREWVAIPVSLSDTWRRLLNEAAGLAASPDLA